jgi:hypothetical protein
MNEKDQVDGMRAPNALEAWHETTEGMRNAPPVVLFGYAFGLGFESAIRATKPQRANAGKPQPTPDSHEERQTKGERHEATEPIILKNSQGARHEEL